LQVEICVTRLSHRAIQELIEFAKDVSAGIENADFETKRRNLELLKVRVDIDWRNVHKTAPRREVEPQFLTAGFHGLLRVVRELDSFIE